jgi:hypothetical protein
VLNVEEPQTFPIGGVAGVRGQRLALSIESN